MHELDDDDRSALLDVLRDVIHDVGVEVFLTRPLVLPDEMHFPDAWSASCRGVGGLLARQLRYAGVVDAHVHVDDVARASDEEGAFVGDVIAFTGVAEHAGVSCLSFKVDLRSANDVDFLVGACAREVARAQRHRAGLHDVDEDALVDVTSHVVGLGVLTTNNALRHRSVVQSTLGERWHLRTEAGALPARAMSFVLAAVAVARGVDSAALTSHLEPNQQTWLRTDMKLLDVSELQQRLGLPASSTANPSPVLTPFLAPIDALITTCTDGIFIADGEIPDVNVNRGRPVFRLRPRATWYGAVGGMVVGAVAVAGVVSVVPSLFAIFGAFVGGWGATIALARQVRRPERCASCEARLEREHDHCPGCGGYLAGIIDDANDRLDAEEAWNRDRALDLESRSNKALQAPLKAPVKEP